MTKEKKKKTGCGTWIILFIIIIFIFTGIQNCSNNSSDSNSSQSHETAKKSKAQKQSEEEKREIKQAKEKNERNNLKDLKNALSKIPNKSDNAITKAIVGSDGEDIELTLNDDALGGTDAQLKSLSKKAWDIGCEYAQKYSPYPDDKINSDTPLIYIYDESGNELGRTSLTGDFKYEGK